MDKNYQNSLDIKKNIKRYLIVMLCCLPLLIVVGVLLEGRVNKAVRIIIFVLILAVVFALEEYLYAKHKTKNKSEKPKQDVFK